MTHYKDQILACDFFTIESLFLTTIYGLFFIELGRRRVHFAGCTRHPNAAWVNQHARQVLWALEEQGVKIRFLLHDNDRKFTDMFDTIFRSVGIKVIHLPWRAPNANAFAERWVRTVRQECLDKLLIFNEDHLQRVVREYIAHYNQKRPHQGIGQQALFHFPHLRHMATSIVERHWEASSTSTIGRPLSSNLHADKVFWGYALYDAHGEA
jgi:putative transposase